MPSSVSRETSADLANPSEMVERIALAMRVWSEDNTHCYCSINCTINWIEFATLAIATMREPTEAMEDAAANHVAPFIMDHREEVREAWMAMVDEALGAKTK